MAESSSVAPSGCTPARATAIPDGSFAGPIDLKVTGAGFSASGFSGGRGVMSVVVEGGSITSGTWKVACRSRGGSTADAMTTKVDVEGTIAGDVSGAAAEPSLTGKWSLDGQAEVDVAGTIPLHFSGTDTETMAIETTGCDEVTGTFIPSFNAQGAGGTTFTGSATWTGSRS